MKINRICFALLPGIILCLIPAFIPSCTHEPAGIEELDTVCFDTQILSVLQPSCGTTGCHDGTTEGFDPTNYTTIMYSVVAGDPQGSPLYKSISDIHAESLMPPGRPLSKETRQIIQVWIAQGAPDKRCSTQTNNNGNDGGGGDGNDSICFQQNILPLFVSKCASCHDGTSHGEEDELHALNSYESIRHHVTPFSPSNSEAYEVVTKSGKDMMPPPPNAPLTSSEKEMLRKWITEGALNSDCPPAACDTSSAISFSRQLNPILQANCVGCHNSTTANGGVNLSSYGHVKSWAETLVQGTSLISGSVKKLPGFKPMPPTFSLDKCSIRKLELWIEQGTANN